MSPSPARRRTKPEPRWRAPVLTRSGWRGPEALEIVAEVEGDAGVLLWRSAINVIRWCEAERDARSTSFGWGAAGPRREMVAGASIDPALRPPLLTLSGLLERPASPDVPSLVDACRRIAAWAEPRGFLATALAFAQCAALLAPNEARLAYEVGRLARRRAEWARAESWLHRAIIISTALRDWRTYALAFSGLGNVYMRRGNYPAARRAHIRCLRKATRHSYADLQANACHDLFLLEVETGRGWAGEEFATRAFRCYGPKHRCIPRLAFDVAFHWVLEGKLRIALPLLEALVPLFTAPADQALTFGLLARAAGGLGQAELYTWSVGKLTTAMQLPGVEDCAAGALLNAAYGAAAMRDWDTAEEAGTTCCVIAGERSQAKICLEAEELLARVRSQDTAPTMTQSRRDPEDLAQLLVHALTNNEGSRGNSPALPHPGPP